MTLREAGALIARLARLEAGHADARALAVAWAQGRLAPRIAAAAGVPTGEHRCPVCGMTSWTPGDAFRCCTGTGLGRDSLTPAELARLADLVELLDG